MSQELELRKKAGLAHSSRGPAALGPKKHHGGTMEDNNSKFRTMTNSRDY